MMNRLLTKLENLPKQQVLWLAVGLSLGLWALVALLATGLPKFAAWVAAL